MKLLLPLPILCLCIYGCVESAFNSADELTEYIASPDSNLSYKNESNGYSVAVSYRPTDLLIAQEVKGKSVDANTVESLRKKYSGYYYFYTPMTLHLLYPRKSEV